MGFLGNLIGGGPLDAAANFMGASAQKKQTKNALRAYDAAGTAAGQARDASVGYYQPFLEGGTTAFNRADDMQSGGFQYNPADPSYGFRLSEGLGAVERSAAAGGALHSGGTLKALNNYAQNVASTEYGNDFARNAGLAAFGMQGAQGSAQAQSGYANALLNIAQGKSGVYEKRGQAIADQWGAGADFVKSTAAAFGGF